MQHKWNSSDGRKTGLGPEAVKGLNVIDDQTIEDQSLLKVFGDLLRDWNFEDGTSRDKRSVFHGSPRRIFTQVIYNCRLGTENIWDY